MITVDSSNLTIEANAADVVIQDSGQSNILTMDSSGEITVKSFSSGSVMFINSSGCLGEDNSNLYFDDSSVFMGIATNTQDDDEKLNVAGKIRSENGFLAELQSSSDIGLRIDLASSPSGNAIQVYDTDNTVTVFKVDDNGSILHRRYESTAVMDLEKYDSGGIGNNEALAKYSFSAYDGNNTYEGAKIQAFADGPWGSTDKPTRLEFFNYS